MICLVSIIVPFFDVVKPIVLEILKKNKQARVKLILNWKMKKIFLKTGDVVEVEAAFHSDIEINVKATKGSKLFKKMVEVVLEKLASFQRMESNWLFESVISLKLHLVEQL